MLLEESRVESVVEALEAIFAETGKPVAARQVGDVVGMKSPQTSRYLHRAKDDGRAKPVPTAKPNWNKGWVPASVDFAESTIDEGAALVAATLAKLFNGKPISGSAIARELGRDVRPVRSWLAHAVTLDTVTQTTSPRGWIPAKQ
jgi:hypothetical protein